MTHKTKKQLAVGLLTIIIMVPLLAMPEPIKAEVPAVIPVTELYGPVAIENLAKQAQMLLGINDSLDKVQSQTNTVMAQARILAAFTGNQKLIQYANMNPIDLLRAQLDDWTVIFSDRVSKAITNWFTSVTSDKTTPDENNGTPEQKKNIKIEASLALGKPDPNIDADKDPEQVKVDRLIMTQQETENISKSILMSYFNDAITPYNATVKSKNENQTWDDSTLQFLKDHQSALNNLSEQLKKSDPQMDTMLAQMKVTNSLLFEIAQSNLRNLQAMTDLLKMQFMVNSKEMEKYFQDKYNEIENTF